MLYVTVCVYGTYFFFWVISSALYIRFVDYSPNNLLTLSFDIATLVAIVWRDVYTCMGGLRTNSNWVVDFPEFRDERGNKLMTCNVRNKNKRAISKKYLTFRCCQL